MLFLYGYIYNWSLLLAAYKAIKLVYRAVTGTSELYRLCSKGVQLARPENEKEKEAQKSSIPAWLLWRIKQCLDHSKNLKVVVQTYRLDSTNQSINSVTQMVADQKGFRPDSPQTKILRHALEQIHSLSQLTHNLDKRAATKFDPKDATHEKKLLELWTHLMPDESLPSRKGDHWSKVGFQGQDPSTDFRGMGMLGLDNLCYYARHHSDSAQEVLNISHHPTAWFSFAIVGINITGFALDLARTEDLDMYFMKHGATTDSFNEFYSRIFDAFGHYWRNAGPTITPMDFGLVFAQFQEDVRNRLRRNDEAGFVMDNKTSVLKKQE